MRVKIATILLTLGFMVLPICAKAFNGEMINFEMRDSKIYPATQRKVTIYVPKEYDGKTPSCLLVMLDRGEKLIAKHFDILIAEFLKKTRSEFLCIPNRSGKTILQRAFLISYTRR